MNQVEIRLPEPAGGTAQEQLARLQSYLTELARQLQYAFDGVDALSSNAPAAAASPSAETTAGSRSNFRAVKSLILKSAEITEHFSEQISRRLTGQFVARSEYGTFMQQTEQQITASAEELRQEFSNLQQIEADVAGLQSSLAEINASIRTGLLGEDSGGLPVYGVEIGQQTRENGVILFRKFARLTADRLSFYDANDVEVAYVSDRKLHITWADVAWLTTDSLTVRQFQMGDYLWQLGADGHLSLR